MLLKRQIEFRVNFLFFGNNSEGKIFPKIDQSASFEIKGRALYFAFRKVLLLGQLAPSGDP